MLYQVRRHGGGGGGAGGQLPPMIPCFNACQLNSEVSHVHYTPYPIMFIPPPHWATFSGLHGGAASRHFATPISKHPGAALVLYPYQR